MTQPVIAVEPQNNRALVALSAFVSASGNYDRFQVPFIVPANTQAMTFGRKNANSGDRLIGPSYTITAYDLVSGAAVKSATTNVTPNAVQAASFSMNFAGMFGWYRLTIACPAGETSPSWFVFVKGSGAMPDVMPVCGGSYDLMHSAEPHRWAVVPAKFEPTIVPLAPRVATPFSSPAPASSLHREYLVPMKGDVDIHRTVKSVDGVVHTHNQQSYAWASLVNKLPSTSLLDGPRGRGSLGFVTHLQPGRNGKTYFCDPWRFGRIDADGTITTLVGFRHGGAIPGDKRPNLSAIELVGDWTDVPAALRQLWECWGAAWWQKTLETDPTAPQIGGEEPHKRGPQAFLTSPQNGCVFRVTFSPTDRSAPAKVTVFASGLNDPWDVVELDDVVYISVRGDHRIAKYDAATGAFLGNLVQGTSACSINASRFPVRVGTLAEIRAQPCVLPEGLFVQDGKVAFGSYAMQQIRNVDPATGAWTVIGEPSFDGNSHFVKIARSDGTFMARGTTFCSTWSSAHMGMPEAILPNGTKWGLNNGSSADKAISQGRGGFWESMGYAAAVGVGNGRCVFGTSMEGVAQLTLALPSDPVIDGQLYTTGFKQWADRGLHLTHGFHGFGYYGLPQAVGVTPAIDHYLTVNGTYPTEEDPAMIEQLKAALAAAEGFANQLQAQIDTLTSERDTAVADRDTAISALAASIAKINAGKAAVAAAQAALA